MGTAANRFVLLARALAALLALTCAAGGQALLEQARLRNHAAPENTGFLFLGAAVLAVLATWRRREPVTGVRPLEIAMLRWWWLVLLLPGVACLGVATAVAKEGAVPRTVFAWWAGGIFLLLLVGAAQAWSTRVERRSDVRDWPRAGLWLAYAVLLVVALGMRVAFDIESFPSFVEADEAFTIAEAGRVFGRDPFDWFRVFWGGVPNISLVCTYAAEVVFGETLWGTRMGGVVFGTVCVLATFAFARRLIGNLPAFTAALLVAVAHTLVHWSRNAHPYIQSPMVAALVLWMLVLVWNRGSLLTWVGAGIVMGVGAQTYQVSQMFPPLVFVTAVGWAVFGRVSYRAALASTAVALIVATLLVGPVARAMLRSPSQVASRGSSLFILGKETRERLGDQFVPELVKHAVRAATMFNVGADHYPNYQAKRSLVDVVTAAMIPVAAAMILARLWTPVGWLCGAWWGFLMVFTVFLANHPPTFHRVPTVLLFSSVAVAWSLVELSAVIRDGFRLGRFTVPAACLAFAVAAGAANFHYYFIEYRHQRGIQHTLGLAQLVCPYAGSHVLVNATALDGHEYVPVNNPPMQVLCNSMQVVSVRHAAEMWDVSRVTRAERVLLVIPTHVVEANPGTPTGYRIVRQFVYERIVYPVRMPLTVYELERL